jgi:hypothetical protein
MAGSSTLTSSVEKRNTEPHIKPVWERVLTFSFVSGDTAEVKQAIPINGLLQKIVVTNSGASGATVTSTVAIDDNADNEIFSAGSLAEATTYNYSVSEPVAGTIDIGVTPSTDPLSAYSVTVTLRGV